MRLKQIAGNVWQISVMPRQSINAYLIGDTLVDAGIKFSARGLLRALKGRDLSSHVLTHAHPDHQGASKAICEARNIPLWCHAREQRAAESGNAVMSYPHPAGVMARLQQSTMSGPGCPVTRLIGEGDEVAGCQVIETPGHSPGHISLWREADRLLIAGDACVGMNLLTTRHGLGLPLADATADMNAAKASLRKLAGLNPAKVAFGHGPVASGDAFRAFVEALASV